MFQSRPQRAAPRPFVAPAPVGRPGDLSHLVQEAVERGRVRLDFQPIVMLGATSPATLREGFVRILDGEGRAIPASRFVSAIDESALGRDLDSAALRLGIAALRARPGLRLAINASPRSLGNGRWRATLEEGLRELGPRLTLELCENSVALLADRVGRFMAELRPSGLRFMLDDFGQSPLSLRQLRDLRFDGLKIGRSLIKDIEASAEDRSLVGALVGVAHCFGTCAIATGVETQGEAAQLRALGVDGLQGFLYGHPGLLP